ncbi:hypothetical protein [Salipiger sp.]|uniref:hypothetical protein n=1 Tax=Salipiger sp. TaxID=2078585 RepID=UPI003A96C62B
MATRKTTDETVTVKMTGAHTYKTGASTRRTLPEGWSGPVPAAIGAEIEKAGKGKIQKPTATEKPKAAKKQTKAETTTPAKAEATTPATKVEATATATAEETTASAAKAGETAPAAPGGSAERGAPGAGDGATG